LKINTTFIEKWLFGSVFSLEELVNRPGFIVFRASGKKAKKIFNREPGGHRFQHISHTGKKDRIHTSTITIAVLDEKDIKTVEISKDDIEEQFTRGSGPGGQHRNKVSTAVILKHIPTGIVIKAENGRSQSTNREIAHSSLLAKLQKTQDEESYIQRKNKRKDQVGSGQRGDKVRTIAIQRDQVLDHTTGKSTTYKKYSRGDFSFLE